MNLTKLLISSSLAISALAAHGVPARPGLLHYRQPDGSFIDVRLVGDEHSHRYLSADGSLLVALPDGTLRAATPDECIDTLKKMSPAKIISGVTPFPCSGAQNALVILVKYTDRAFTYDADRFDRMLNEPGFSDFGAYGSARDYFIENSGNRFQPVFDVYGPVELSHDVAYYGADDDARAHEMVAEACRALDDTVDFSKYDRDGDGWVDNVYLFYAGYGEGDGGGVNTVWPHSSNLYNKGTRLILDGVQIGAYACSNELIAGSNSMVGMGTFCHEFGHVLGLPDLYTTDYSEAFTPGDWSLMDHGNYLGNSRCPAALTAYERSFLTWLNPIEVNMDASLNIPALDSDVAYVIPTGKEGEYFLLENRQKKGWDSYLPGHGMLVWHIDYDKYSWDMNIVNNNASHPRVDIIEADGIQTEASVAADPFPGTANVSSLDDIRTWASTTTGISLKNIKETSGVITLDVNGVATTAPAVPSGIAAADVADNSASLSWTPVDGADAYLLDVFTLENNRPRNLAPYSALKVSTTSVRLDDLTPDTEYTVRVRSLAGITLSDASAPCSFQTLEPGISYFAPVACDPKDVQNNAFIATWNPLNAAESYELTVYTEQEGAAIADVLDFSSRLELPQGWSTTCANTMSVKGYYGESAPSLRFLANADKLISPQYDAPITSLSFWMRGYQNTAADALVLSVLRDDEWQEAARLTDIDSATAVTYTADENLLGAAKAFMLTFEKTADSPASASVLVDDVNVALGHATETINVLDAVNVGNVTEYPVTDLMPGTDYYYSVKGVAGDKRSMESNVVKVTTQGSSAIRSISDGGMTILSAGRSVAVSAPGAISIYSASGSLVARGNASLNASLAPSIYIVTAQGISRKVIIR